MVTPEGDTYTYHYNGIGSTIALTDQDKNLVNKYFYTPFGLLTNQLESIPQPFKYAGRHGIMYEPDGLYYMRARYYDPLVGRFISEDPIGFGGGDVNLYAYALNNPINYVDPLGLEAGGTSAWVEAGNVLDIIFGVGTAYAGELTNNYDNSYEQLLQEQSKLNSELMLNILSFHGGTGGAMIGIGIRVLPYNPIAGGVLITGGAALEIKVIFEFIDWAKRYGNLYNQIREAQEQY